MERYLTRLVQLAIASIINPFSTGVVAGLTLQSQRLPQTTKKIVQLKYRLQNRKCESQFKNKFVISWTRCMLKRCHKNLSITMLLKLLQVLSINHI